METSGQILRRLRMEKGFSLEQVALDTHINHAFLSKIEHGQQKASLEQISRLATFFGMDDNILLASWLSDKIAYSSVDEEMSKPVRQVAEKRIAYMASSTSTIIQSIKAFFQKDGRVASAWLFGSFAREEQKSRSDVDIMIELNSKKKYSMFDIIDISFLIEKQIGIKVDIVEKGYLKSAALNTAQNDLIKIYG